MVKKKNHNVEEPEDKNKPTFGPIIVKENRKPRFNRITEPPPRAARLENPIQEERADECDESDDEEENKA